MHELGTYITTVYMENDYKRAVKLLTEPTKRRFDTSSVYNVRVYSLKPFYRPIEEAVYIDGKDWVLDLKKIIALGVDCFRLEVDYRMNTGGLNGFVKGHSSKERLRDKLRYHLSAQLKDPDSLIKGFKSVEIDEYPVTARVHIQENISIPQYIRDIVGLRRDRVMAGTPYNTSDKAIANNPHYIRDLIKTRQSDIMFRKKYKDMDIYNKLQEIAFFLHSKEIYNYFIMPPQKDFRLDSCAPSDECETIGAFYLPKVMEVVSRTDLTLKKPATCGEIIYEQDSFSEKIQKILGK